MKKLTFIAPDQLLDTLSSALFEAGARGLQEGVGSLITYVSNAEEESQLRLAIESLRLALENTETGADIEIETQEVDDSWQDTWQDALEAVSLAENWVLRPTHQRPAPADEDTIWFQPQASFGDGSHPTTQLAARRLVHYLQNLSAATQSELSIADVGAGNGVLCLIALKEAERAGINIKKLMALDIDEVAINSLKQNLELNGYNHNAVSLHLGTIEPQDGPFDLTVANINTPVLLQLATRLANSLKEGGTLILTGLLVEDEASILATYSALPLSLMKSERQGEWSLLLFQQK